MRKNPVSIANAVVLAYLVAALLAKAAIVGLIVWLLVAAIRYLQVAA